MRYFIRLGIGATVIFLILVLIVPNSRFFYNALAKSMPPVVSAGDIYRYIAAGGAAIAPGVDWDSLAPAIADYKKALDAEDWYRRNRAFVPVFGYNESKKILIPYNLIGKVAQQPWTYPEGAIVLASSRDAVVNFSNDTKERIDILEERIRKLENTVAKIISKCCPEAK